MCACAVVSMCVRLAVKPQDSLTEGGRGSCYLWTQSIWPSQVFTFFFILNITRLFSCSVLGPTGNSVRYFLLLLTQSVQTNSLKGKKMKKSSKK